LNALDFLVCIDRNLTADAAYADIVLPATTMYEIQSYMTYGPVFSIREKVIEPVGEARNDFFIMSELAARLGYGHLYPQNEEELLRHVLKGSGFSLEDVRAGGGTVQKPGAIMQYKKWEKGLLRPDGKPGFDTPTGKFEIYSTILEEHGYDPLPVYTDPQEGPVSSPELARDFPLVFNSGARVTTDFRSQHHNIKGLCKERPEPTVTINSDDAEKRGITDGDIVMIKTLRGEINMRAYVTDDIVRGAVDANMGGGGPLGPKAWQECNINELTDLGQYDPISGFPVYKALLCDVTRVVEGSIGMKMDSGEYAIAGCSINNTDKATASARIYLDNNATTPLDPAVRSVMIENMENSYGNPSSIYREGKASHISVETARRSVAQLINSTARRIVFTGGGSEANNLALKGIALSGLKSKNHIITSSIEHPSILSTAEWLKKFGFEITYLRVNKYGVVNPDDLVSAISDKTCLVSIMTAHNETGVIQPVSLLADITRRHGVLFHTDATQAAGKIPLDVESLGVDMLTISGHKLHGPKGVGALYIRRGIELAPLIHGGGQEGGLRSGTENTAGITGLGKAAELSVQYLPEMNRVRNLRNLLEKSILELYPEATVNGHNADRLPNTLNICLPGLRGESIVMTMDRKGVAFSSGSACRAGSPKPSHGLLAMGLSEEDAHCSVRFSLGRQNSADEINRAMSMLKETIRNSAEIVRFVPCR